MIAPGFYRMSLWGYLTCAGVNRSFLHDLVTLCPDEARWNTENQETTEPMRLGDATHAAILEPDRFENGYVVLPADCSPGSGPGMKDRKEAFLADAAKKGRHIISTAQKQNIVEMQNVIQSDDNCTRLLSDGEPELSGFYLEPEFDVLCKFRADYLNKRLHLDADLKTAATVQHFPFRASAYSHGYDIQAYSTLRGLHILTGVEHTFRFIVIASQGYHGLKIYDADAELLASGEDRYFKALEIYTQCMESGDWPRYDSTPEPLGVPEFRKNQLINRGII